MKDFKMELRWGLIFSLLTMILGFVEKMYLGWHDKYIDQQMGGHFLILLALYVVVFYLGIREKRNYYYKNKMTWKEGIISGGMITVIVALLTPLSVFFIYHYASPNFFHNMIDYQTHKANFPMSKDNAEEFFNMGSYIILEISTAFSFGIGVSALLSLFLRTQKREK